MKAAIAACCLFVGLPLMAQERGKKLDELEPVVIVGGYATPQMWKVSKDGHVMWVLNIGEPAPAGARWRSEELEARVAESQLVLYPNSTSWTYPANFGPPIRRDERYSGKATLKDELPPETYARWRLLKTAYFGADDSIEKWRPSVAMEKLEEKVMKAMRPPPPTGPALRPLVDKMVKKYKVKVRTMPTVHRPPVESTKAEQEMVRMNSVQDLGDMKCFTQHLDYLERLIAHRNQQVHATSEDNAAWIDARGCYFRRLKSGDFPDPAAARSAYEKLMLRPKLAWLQMDAEWMAAAKAALEKNKSTFAVLYKRRVTASRCGWEECASNYVAKFRELGYEVEEPGNAVE
jgi:hypothetical protein